MVLFKAIGTPGSLMFIAVCVVVGVAQMLLWPRHRRLGKAWLVLVFALYGVLGIPWVADSIAKRLTTFRPGAPIAPGSINALVIFDGDNRRGRVREALRVLDAENPRDVWVLGAAWIVDDLVDAGVPRARITHDTSTTNTREQLAWVGRLTVERPDSRAAIVASRLQMPRIAALAKALGVKAALLPSEIDVEPPTEGWRRFMLTYYALRVSRDALYEHAALAYYRWKGWI